MKLIEINRVEINRGVIPTIVPADRIFSLEISEHIVTIGHDPSRTMTLHFGTGKEAREFFERIKKELEEA